MDPVTQASLGAVVGGLTLGSQLGRKAVLLGAAVAIVPDLDILIDYGDDVSNFIYHRGFSHSLLLHLTVATAVAGLLARAPATRAIGFSSWWWFLFLVLSTHVLLDALTTYGTQLVWPLAGPVGTGSIFVIDPLYTLPLLVAASGALLYRFAPRLLLAGLVMSSAYAGSGLVLNTWIDHRIQPALVAMDLEDRPRLIQPTPFNLLLWRITILDGERFHEAWVSILDTPVRPDFEAFERGTPLAAEALALADGQRLHWFAGDFLRFHRNEYDGTPDRLVVTDLRLGAPGYFPFGFEIAELRDGEWQPITSRQVRETGRPLKAIRAMIQRIVDPFGAPCLMELAETGYAIPESRPRCRVGRKETAHKEGL
jgi:inner membrane protein